MRPGAAAGAGAANGLWLEWERAGFKSRLPLNRPLTIGRDAEADVRLPDPTVSRRHAVVTLVGGQALVDATGSTNGVQLDRGRADRASLSLGQSFRIGDTTFRVVGAQGPVAAPVATPEPTAWSPVGPPPLPQRPSLPGYAAAGHVRPAPTPNRGALVAAAAVGLVAILVVSAILGLAILHPASEQSSAPGQPSAGATRGAWTVSSGAIPSNAPPGLTSAIESFAPPAPVFGSGFVVETVRTEGDWAIAFGHAVAGPSDSSTPTETIVVIAHRTDAGWQTVSNRDDRFCSALAELPDGIMNATERSYYGCS